MTPLDWNPATPHELTQMVEANFRGPKLPLMPVGGQTALHYGKAVSGSPRHVLTERLARVVDYPARDMTITVEAGMRVADLQACLAVEHQQLPIDIAQSNRATIGGAVAANTCGPAQFGYGTFRDYVIGISAVDGQGRLFSAGGRVVKNVAGYDLCKLLIGSLGTLGIMTQITFKLTPCPACRTFVIVRCQQLSQLEPVLESLNLSATRPVILDLLNAKAIRQLQTEMQLALPSDPYLLCIGYAGSAVEVRWQAETAISELKNRGVITPRQTDDEDAQRLWEGLTEYQVTSNVPVTFQVNLLPSHVLEFMEFCAKFDIALQSHAGNGIVLGHLPESDADVESAANLIRTLRVRVSELMGTLVILNCEDHWNSQLDIFGSPLPGEPMMRKLKQVFDPAGILSPGRFW